MTQEELRKIAFDIAFAVQVTPSVFAPDFFTGDHRDVLVVLGVRSAALPACDIVEYAHPSAIRAGTILAKILARPTAEKWVAVVYTKRHRPSTHDRAMALRLMAAGRLVDIPVHAVAFANKAGVEILELHEEQK